MNKKQVFSIFLLFVFSLSLLASAFAYDVSDDELVIGDPDLNIAKTTFRTKIKQFFDTQAFTVIGGAACSTEPDFSKDYVTSQTNPTPLCKSNYQYAGIAFQLFEVRSDGSFDLVGEKQIPYSSKACFDIEPNVNYHMSFYICDSTAQRSCSDTDGTDMTTKGVVKYTVDGSSSSYTDKCLSNFEVQEYYCVDNSVSSRTYSCNSCVDGACDGSFVGPQEDERIEVVEKDLSINVYDVSAPSSALLDEKFVVKGKLSISGICNGCVVETGTDFSGQPLALSSLGEGACGDDSTVGVKFNGENEVLEFYLADKSSQEGTFRVPVVAYDRCGGVVLDREYFTIDIFAPIIDEAPSDDGSSSSGESDSGETIDTIDCFVCVGDTPVPKTLEGTSCPQGTSSVVPDCSVSQDYNNDDGSTPLNPGQGESSESNPIVRTDDPLNPESDSTLLISVIVVIVFILFLLIFFSGDKK